eukprot:365810-Chlamydomonas_euryale.AAC.16
MSSTFSSFCNWSSSGRLLSILPSSTSTRSSTSGDSAPPGKASMALLASSRRCSSVSDPSAAGHSPSWLLLASRTLAPGPTSATPSGSSRKPRSRSPTMPVCTHVAVMRELSGWPTSPA